MSLTSSASLIGVSGCLRSCVIVVVKPLTSSPAIPITTCVGRKPAISSASWRATAQLSTTAAMSATVPDCMWLRPWRLRPTPRTVPWPSSSISNTSALANSVPMSSEVQAARAEPSVPVPDPAQERHLPRLAAPDRGRVTRRRRGRQPRREPPRSRLRAPPGACPCPAPSRGARRPGRRSRVTAPWTSDAGRDATRDEVVADGDEQLRLVGVEPQRDDARRQRAADILGEALERVHRLEVEAARRRTRTPGRDSSARPREVAGLRPAGRRRASRSRRFVSRSSPWSAAIRSSSASGRPCADGRRRPVERANRSSMQAVGRGAGDGLDAPHPRADAPLAGDHEAARPGRWRGSGCRRTARG